MTTENETTGLSDKELIEIARQEWHDDPYMHGDNPAGFDPKVHPEMIGWHIDNFDRRAYPAYRIDSGLFVVKHKKFGPGVINARIEQNQILPK